MSDREEFPLAFWSFDHLQRMREAQAKRGNHRLVEICDRYIKTRMESAQKNA